MLGNHQLVHVLGFTCVDDTLAHMAAHADTTCPLPQEREKGWGVGVPAVLYKASQLRGSACQKPLLTAPNSAPSAPKSSTSTTMYRVCWSPPLPALDHLGPPTP